MFYKFAGGVRICRYHLRLLIERNEIVTAAALSCRYYVCLYCALLCTLHYGKFMFVYVVKLLSNVIDDENLKEFDFLKKKTEMVMPQPVAAPRGVDTEKKAKICEKLVPLMPAKYRAFWNELPNSDSSKDLLEA